MVQAGAASKEHPVVSEVLVVPFQEGPVVEGGQSVGVASLREGVEEWSVEEAKSSEVLAFGLQPSFEEVPLAF